MKSKYEVVFCVLTYKNHSDLEDFIQSIKVHKESKFSYKIIVVNNYSDDISLGKIRDVAKAKNCDFIESENKGYSVGNNIGIRYAIDNYEFDFLIVSNPDILIRKLNIEILQRYKNKIVAPEIICLNNKKQNPMYYKKTKMSNKIIYAGFKKRRNLYLYTGIFIKKIKKKISGLFTMFTRQNEVEIYGCHGSFIIFSEYALKKLDPVFDENIFLFCEEDILAKKAEENNVKIIYDKSQIVDHKEDGSMRLSNQNLYEIHRESFLYYYDRWESRKN